MTRARVLAAFALAALYLWGLAPSVHVHDAGELTAAAWTLGVGHPPGAPLYMLLSKAFLLLVPLGSLAWRANLFSAAAAVGAFLAFDAAARRVTGRPGLSLAGAGAFALSATFWSQAEMAEVYTLHALLLLLFLWAFAGDRTDGRQSALAAFLWGLLLTCHVGLAPLTPVVLALLAPRTAGEGFRLWARRGVRLLPPLLLPLTLYAYVPLRSLRDPFVDWGNPEGPRALWWHLTNRQVRGRMLSLPWQSYLDRGAEYLGILAANLHLLLPFALLGLAVGWRRNRALALLLTTVGLADGLFVILMDTAPLASEAYAIPSVAALALLAVWGLSSSGRPLWARAAVAAASIAAALSLGANFRSVDLHENFLVRDAAESLLAQVPPGATLLVQEDSTTNPLAYLVGVEGARPDVEILDRFGNLFGSLYERPPFTVDAAEYPAFRRSREEPAVALRLAQGRPVLFSTPHLDYSPEAFRLIPGEFASRACLPGEACVSPAGPPGPPPRPGRRPDWMSRQILAELATRKAAAALAAGRPDEAVQALSLALARADLPELLLLTGQLARRAGDPSLALNAADAALARRRDFAPAMSLRGSLLLEMHREREGEEDLRAAVAADPTLAQPHALLGQLAARRGEWALAREEFGRALDRGGPQADLLHDRARTSLALGDTGSAETDLRRALALFPAHRAARLRLARLLGESGRTQEAGQVLCGGCVGAPPSSWDAPGLRELLLVAARSGFPPCVGRWLEASPPTADPGRGVAVSYLAAESEVRRAQQR